MRWPEPWVPIDDRSEAAAFERELRRQLTPGHLLFGLPLRAIGRRWDNIDGLFALEDGTGRVAVVILPWGHGPWEQEPAHVLFPLSLVCDSLDEWIRQAEWAMTLARLKPADIQPKWKPGDRVLMLAHFDWKADVPATIIREGRPRIIDDGTTHVEYLIEFDEPQSDLTDASYGLPIEYEGTGVLEEYLRLLSQEPA